MFSANDHYIHPSDIRNLRTELLSANSLTAEEQRLIMEYRNNGSKLTLSGATLSEQDTDHYEELPPAPLHPKLSASPASVW